jgi:DNA repair protein RadC
MKKQENELKNVAVRLVEQPSFLSDEKIDSPEAAVRVLGKELKDYDREVLCVVNMNTKGRPINASIVSMGILDASLAHPREIMKTAILSNASQIILLHNHISGEVEPSRQDVALTDRMQKVCELMGIPLADHVIVGDNRYFSFREKSILPMDKVSYSGNLDEVNLGKSRVAEEKESVIGRIHKLQSEIDKPGDRKNVEKGKERQAAIR